MASIGRYRKIESRIWNDAKFHGLDDKGKLAFFLVLTHPHMTALGAMRATMGGLADELKWTHDAMHDAMRDAMSLGLVEMDEKACYVGLPNFLKYNEPEGPNSVVKAWPQALELIPECAFKEKLIARCRSYLEARSPEFKQAMGDAIWDAFKTPCHIQEQEQEQEQEQLTGTVNSKQQKPRAALFADPSEEGAQAKEAASLRKADRRACRIPEDFRVTDQHREFARVNSLPDPDVEMPKFRDHYLAASGAKALALDWDAKFRSWLRKAAEFNGGRRQFKNGKSNHIGLDKIDHQGSLKANSDGSYAI